MEYTRDGWFYKNLIHHFRQLAEKGECLQVRLDTGEELALHSIASPHKPDTGTDIALAVVVGQDYKRWIVNLNRIVAYSWKDLDSTADPKGHVPVQEEKQGIGFAIPE